LIDFARIFIVYFLVLTSQSETVVVSGTKNCEKRRAQIIILGYS